MATESGSRRWTIGELAQASGLTVRTLHHYDEIGLLPASERTASGHRRYTETDLRRLYRVRALRGLGLSLGEIRTALEERPDETGADVTALRSLLTVQLGALQASLSRIETLRVQITELLREIDHNASPDPDRIMKALEMMTVFDTYLTARQQEFLAERRADIGADGVEALKAEWLALVEQLRHHQRLDTPPSDRTVQSLAGRWDALAARFHGGDERIKAASHRMWADNSAEICARLGWSVDGTTGLLAYLARARDAAGPDQVSSR